MLAIGFNFSVGKEGAFGARRIGFANRLSRALGLAVLGIAFLSLAAAPPAEAASLLDELVGLLDDHPRIKGSVDNISAAEEAVGKAESFYYPSVALTGDRGFKSIAGPAQRAANNIYNRKFDQWGLSVTQNLWDGWRKNNEVLSAEIGHEAAKGILVETRQGILFEAASAYVDISRQMALVRLARKSEATIANRLDLEDERVERGGGTAVDVLLSKTRLQRAKEQRIVFEGNLRDAVTRYTQVFGHGPDLETHEDPPLSVELMPETLDLAVATSLVGNPQVASSNRQIDLARVRQKVIRADYFPRLDVVGAANFEDDREGTIGIRRDWSVTLQATWNLFSGFSTKAGVAEAAYGYSSSINNHLFVNRKVEEEIRLAWQGVLTACDRRLLLNNAVTISSEVYSSRVKLRDAGQETVINVLDAENEVFSAEINLVAATYDEKASLFRLAIGMGHSLTEVLANVLEAEDQARAQEIYDIRCRERLETIAVRGTPKVAPRKADPFAAPAEETDDEDTANPFATPKEGAEEEEGAANPFAEPVEQEESEKSGAANPFDGPKAEDDDLPGAQTGKRPKKLRRDLISRIDDDAGETVEQEILRLASLAPTAMSRVLDGVDEELGLSERRSESLRPGANFQWDENLGLNGPGQLRSTE